MIALDELLGKECTLILRNVCDDGMVLRREVPWAGHHNGGQ